MIGESGEQGGTAEIIEMPRVRNYRDLLVWKQAMELVTLIYKLTQAFPKEETYGLTNQIRRAAVSIPSNIAEGHARGHLKEYIQFLSVSIGSLAELQTQMVIAQQLSYVSDKESFAIADDLADKTMKTLKNLQRTLKEKTTPQ